MKASVFCVFVTLIVQLGLDYCAYAQVTDSKTKTQTTVEEAKFKKAKKEIEEAPKKEKGKSTPGYKKAKKQEENPDKVESD